MGDRKNKLILFLSTYKFGNKEWFYKSKYDNTKNEIKGIQTPDAPTKYFINYLDEIGEKIDTILCITSEKANNKSTKRGDDKIYDSAFEDYEKMLNNFCDERGVEVPELVKLNFDYDFENDIPIKDSDIYRDLFENIVEKLSEDKQSKDEEVKDVIYIDYTSGIRDTSLLIILMIRYLEYTGIKCGGMIYSYYDNDDQTKNKIIDIKSTYDLFELLNGVNEFTSFGKSKSLSNYYANMSKDNTNYKEIKELIDVMDEFSDMMSLCIVEDMDRIIFDLNSKILAVRELRDKDDLKDDKNKLMVYMFLNLIKEIENKFYLSKGEDIKYINLIKWCLDNDLIQQALTLYVEKIPEYYEECGFFDKEDYELKETIKDNNINNNDIAKIFYTAIFVSLSKINKNYDDDSCEEEINKKDEAKNTRERLKNIIKVNKWNILSRDNKYLKKYDEKIQKAIKEIYSMMDELYIKGKTDAKIYDRNLSEFNPIIPTSEEKFINWMNQQNKVLNYLLGIEEGESSNKEVKINPRDNTYDNKLKIINMARNNGINPNWSELPLDDLLEIMQDYLFFKIMRNQINHAKKSNLSPFVNKYFENIGYKTEITISNIKNVMKKSIENIERIAREKKEYDLF